MKKTIGIVLVGALTAFSVGCGDDDEPMNGSGGSGGGGGENGAAELCVTPGEQVTLAASISEDTRLTADCTYSINKLTYVEGGATLFIDAGVEVFGLSGTEAAALVITKSGRIEAVGTATDPIVLTSANRVTQRSSGDWGGVVLIGEARINSGTSISGSGEGCDGAAGDCEGTVEGLPANERGNYGGNDDAHDCGTLKYVRIEFAGFKITEGNELNTLSVYACGSQTEISYVQAHRGLDDAFEWFGGTSQNDHLLATGFDDDGFDWDQGFTGTIEYGIIDHYAGGSPDPRGFETDNNGSDFDSEPRSAPTVKYVTLIGYNDAGADPPQKTFQGILNREGTRGEMEGLIVAGDFGEEGFDVQDNGWDGAWPTTYFVKDSCFFNEGGRNFPDDTDDPDDEMAGSPNYFDEPDQLTLEALNNTVVDPGLSDTVGAGITGGDPDYSITNTTDCIGGFGPEQTDWTDGWTAQPVN